MHGPLHLWITLAIVGTALVWGDVAAARARSQRARANVAWALHSSTHAKRLDASDGAPLDVLAFELVSTDALRAGDLLLCTPGDVLAVAGEVLEGAASVDAPPAAGDPGSSARAPMHESMHASARGRTRVAGGTTVRSGYLVVRVLATRDLAAHADPRR